MDCSTAARMARQRAHALCQRRTAHSSLWDKSVDVLRRGAATDQYSRPALGAETVVHKYPCAVLAVPKQDQEEVESQRPVATGERRVSLPVDADVRGTDRLRVFDLDGNGRRVGTGRLYEVAGVQDGLSQAKDLTVYVKADSSEKS